MTASAFLDLCLDADSALERVLAQLQEAGERDAFGNGPLQLHADGHHLQLSTTELAAALGELISQAEDRLAQIAQRTSLADDGPFGTSKPGEGSEGTREGPHASSSSVSLPSGHSHAAGTCLEPGRLDLASFPSLGSTRQQKVRSVLLLTELMSLHSANQQPVQSGRITEKEPRRQLFS